MNAPAPSRRDATRILLAAAFAPLAPGMGRAAFAADDPVLSIGHRGGTTDFPRSVIEAMPMRTLNVATPWTDGRIAFAGPLLRDVLARAGIDPSAGKIIVARALNDYVVEIPLSDPFEHDVIVAVRENGSHMPVRKRGPFFVLYPLDQPALWDERYFSRCAWQLRSLDVQ